MVIRFKKLETISDKVYVSFDNEKTFFEFDVEQLKNSHILFGKGSSEEKAYIEFFKRTGEGIISIECNATPESLENIKIFARDSNEVWTPKYTRQRKLAYDNESPETVYINYEQNPNAFKEYLESENTQTDIKVYNIYGDQVYEDKVYRMDLADQFRDTLKESGKTLNLGSSILPPRKNYDEFFENVRNISYGPELPDETTSADAMYKNSSIRKAISLSGSLESAVEIFKDSNIKTMPIEFGESLINISKAFENCVFDETDLSDIILGKNIQNMSGSFKGSNIKLAPKIPEFISNLDAAFENCQSLEEIPNFELNKAPQLSLQSTFRQCHNLGKSSAGISGLPSHIVNMSGAFSNCENLKYFFQPLPDDVVYAQSAFEGCTSLEKAPLLNSKVEDIQNIFYNCSLVSNPQNNGNEMITLPESVKRMDGSFFGTGIKRTPIMSDAKNLESMDKAFHNCTSLTYVEDINRFAPLKSVLNAFDGEASITHFPDFPFACEDDFSWKFSVGQRAESLNNRNSLESIGSIENRVSGFVGAFKNANRLKSVGQISLNNIVSIDSAFQGCSSLAVSPFIKIFGNSTSGKYLFEGCSSLWKITNFPKVVSLESAFENCVKITGKDIQSYKSDIEIDSSSLSPLPTEYDSDESGLYVDVLNMFRGCTSLKEITFPRNAFNAENICGGLNDSVEIINQLPNNLVEPSQVRTLFNNFKNVKVVRRVPNIYDISGWFTGHSNLISCAFDDNNLITTMNDTFNGCSNLRNTSVIEEEDELGNISEVEICQLIADEDFSQFKVSVPPYVQYMVNAFKGCSQLTEIDTIPETVIDATSAFENCSSLSKIGNIYSIQGKFTNAFKGAKVSLINKIASKDGLTSITLNGSGLETTLKTVKEVSGNNMERLFENCSALSKINKIPTNLSNVNFTFKGCSSLKSLPASLSIFAKEAVGTFENSGITIDDSNYTKFFTGETPQLTSVFNGCKNVTVTPKPNHSGKVEYSDTYKNSGVKKVYLADNVTYRDNCFEGTDIEEAIFVSASSSFSNTIFDDKPNFKKIKNLEFNPAYSMSAISFKAEKAEEIITEEGKLLDVIDSAIETPNSIIYKVFGTTPEEALENAQLEAEKYSGKVIPTDVTPAASIPVKTPIITEEEYEEEVEVVDDDGNVSTETVTKTREKTEYIESETLLYYRNVEVSNSTFDISKKKLGEYIDWLYENEYIKTTQFITEENISSTVSTYFSKLGDYFPYLEEVEQVSANNSSGIFACGNILNINPDDNTLDSENMYGAITGPTTLKRVIGKSGEGISTSNVSNLSHAFFHNTSIQYVGDIPPTITGLDKPFEGCTGLIEVGNVEANVLTFSELFKDCTSLKEVGKIGKDHSVTYSVEKAFSGCTSLREVGGIFGDIENFRFTFENCTSLKNIGFLSTDTFRTAQKKKENIAGMFFNTANDIYISTEEGSASELKNLLLSNAEVIRNKQEKDKRGNVIYNYNIDEETGKGRAFTKEECEDWVNNHVFIS